ncbi:leucine-rich repeat-containing protein kinase family protein [uncultured Cocleimonas sp.]|uniref:leucine-rich repeat-containing protein kinase family protein n=1 Tax=uncultured Cocleimonas sp. TaxID=1051587 RepID=UPI00262B2988|nr:protein kinase [uncultured Cocleimonas sp.]
MHTLSQLQSGELSGIQRLSLSENLTSFPMEILSLADSLEILDLTDNNLSSLPEELVQLQKLKILFVSDNDFEELPEVLGQCLNLEMIGFKSNKIKHVPENALPPKLRWLILTDNQIAKMPDSLGERPRLQKLALAGNRLTELPQTLAKSTNLELVRISANKLTECPDQLLGLPKLAWFAFSGNPFSYSDIEIKSAPEIPSKSYELLEELGRGASGVISRARWNQQQSEYHIQFQNDIAVKVFKGEVTSDGYPKDELNACLKVGNHPNLVKSLAQVNETGLNGKGNLALIMSLIPPHFDNLGQPPNFETCTRDTFPDDFFLSIAQIQKMVEQMEDVFNHLHSSQVCHGDLYAHNALFDEEANIIVGDFGAATMYHMVNEKQQAQIKQIERRALNYFIEDLLSVCREEDKTSETYKNLERKITG